MSCNRPTTSSDRCLWRWATTISLSCHTFTAAAQNAPDVAALSAILMNPATGEVLYAKAPHTQLPPASTTKVLTALVVLERADPNMRIPVSAQAANAAPSRVGLRPGESAMVQDLLYGLMLKSGNDAAEVLAEGIGGSVPGFADLMNAKARQIGANDSHFVNPHGLPAENHYSSVYDLAIIFRQAMQHPLFADIVRTRSAGLRVESPRGPDDQPRMVMVQTHNRLLASYEGARGGKTGFTFKARQCFVGEVSRGGVRLIVALLNSPHRATLWQDARKLLDYGFTRYGIGPAPAPRGEESTPTVARKGRTRPQPVERDDDDDEVAAAPVARTARAPAAKPAKAQVAKAAPAPAAPKLVPAKAAPPKTAKPARTPQER